MKITLDDIFYASVDRFPERTAIEYGAQSITYRELDQLSNVVANSILEKGLARDAKVGIFVSDRIELISIMLGVLKAGAVFVPFDTSFPVKRLESLIEQVDFQLCFTSAANAALAEELFQGAAGALERVHYDRFASVWQDPTLQGRPDVEHQPDDPAYIYFTSGSTGRPKGILGRYKGLLHFIQWELETFQINETFRTSQFVTPSFDAFLRDALVPLCAGGTLCIPADQETLLSADRLARWLESARINLVHCVPSVFRLLLTGELAHGNFPELRWILMSGERINPKDLRLWYGIFGSRVQLVNLYGPSETTMVKTFYLITEEDQHKASIPIGQPTRGARVLILDEQMKPCPVSMVGEIYIRTPFMTLGYYNAPELTRERFIQNPYSTDPNDLLYRTGDLGRALADGNYELIGRKDTQVKIRGVRVELGDIENQILAHPAVREVTVVDRENGDGELYLSAYFVAREQVSSGEIRTFLAGRVPDIMVPAFIVELEKLPLTPNGKVDRKALPEPDWRLSSGVAYVAPETPLEASLCAIWSELLGIEQIGIHDNFFDLGGHSLKATRLEARINQQFAVEVPLQVIFQKPTIRELALYIATSNQNKRTVIPVAGEQVHYPASFAQKRLYVVNQFSGPNLAYNMPRVYMLTGELKLARLEEALRKLFWRQAILRTSFTVVDGEPVQVVHPEVDFVLEIYGENLIGDGVKDDKTTSSDEANLEGETTTPLLSAKSSNDNHLASQIHAEIQRFIRPFDFSQAPLLRVGLIQLAADRQILLLDMHHIISDQISMGVLMNELLHLYEGNVLAPLPLQYKDYAVWQHTLVQDGEMQKQEAFWLEQLQEDLPVLTLPTDYPRPAVKGTAGDVYNFTLDRHSTDRLYQLAKAEGATLYMVLLAAFNTLLAKYSGQEDIVLGTPLAGRPVPELDSVIGMFVNTLPMRNRPVALKTFQEFVAEVKENTLAVFAHQDYQMDLLIERLDLARDMSRNPLFDVMLVLQNEIEKADLAVQEVAGLLVKPYPFELQRSKFDFILFAMESEEGLVWQLEYSTELYQAETMERLAGHWLELLVQICQHPDRQLGQLTMLRAEEKDLLLAFNDRKLDYPRAKTIHQLFEEQVQKTPERIALRFEGTELSYAELNQRANQLARVLRKHGVGAPKVTASADTVTQPESIVGIMLKRSPEMVVGLLAILKAGGAYLPIDPDYPEERVLYMLENAGADLLLTDSAQIRAIPFTALENIAAVDAEIVLTGIRSHIKEFDRLPVPDRSLIDLSKYKNKIGMASIAHCISLQTSRGCPYQCLYCHKVWSKSHVYRSAENIYSEVEFYYQRGVRNFAILDDCFNLNRENSMRFFQLIIKNGLKVKIFFPNGLRGDLLTQDYIDLMVEAGTVNINLSLETASPRLQKAVKKYLDIDKFRDVMEYIATQHPNVILELATMLGFPTETEEEALQTLQFIQSIQWIHFPYIHVLKVFPNTEMEEFALANGVQKEAILRSVGLAYHELPETLPFSKNFARQYQSRFLNEYFLNPERLKKVLPVQMHNIDPAALIQKYDAYLPVEVTKLEDVLDFAGITDFTLPKSNLEIEVPEIFETAADVRRPVPGASTKKILFLDLSQHFSSHDMLYNVAEQPLGLLYLLTYVKEQFGTAIDGRIYKARNDFDSYRELKAIVDEYQPDLIGIRTLSFYREFFHETVSLLRDWGVTAPIITGGPYATSEYETILRDPHVDIAVIGEGEYTLAELVEAMLKHDFRVPPVDVLEGISGIAYNRTYRTTMDARFSAGGVEMGDAQTEKMTLATQEGRTARKVLLLDELGDTLLQEADHNLGESSTGADLAYVMYTSGTTGRPKGIMVEHRQVNNCIFWMQDEFQLDENAVIVQRTNLTFDPSVWEIFWPLYIGGTVRLVTTDQGKDADFLLDLLSVEQERLTMIYCPASLATGMVYLLQGRENIRLRMPWFLIGAEPIRPEVVKNLYKNLDGTVVNTYGPTECTINNTYLHIERDREYPVIPIGRPVANNELYILSKDLQLLPLGMVGEICIAGESVARGYIHNPEKTAENFVKNPFGAGCLYKTGDLGRWLLDGNIEILGRVDDQVKVRGYRIEPAEIESALLKQPGIREAVVIVKDPKEKRKNIKTCKFCGITSAYPGVTIHPDGVCNLCDEFSHYEEIAAQYFQAPTELWRIIEQSNQKKDVRTPDAGGTPQYDLLLLYAGGRGSAYALYQLVEQGFKVLTATYDNGFFSAGDKTRIERITASVGVDHVWLTHPETGRILAESLRHAHTACNGCFFASSSLAVSYAEAHGIKVVVGATLSRGQIIENKLYKLMKQGITSVPALESELASLQRSTADMNRHIFDLLDLPAVDDGSVYDAVRVVDFYRYFDISNQEMIAYLNARDPYWTKRKNYAIYSTNCAIKQLGDYYHLHENGYHYYGAATSWEKRLQHITLENVQKDLQCCVGPEAFANFSSMIHYELSRTAEKLDAKYLCAYLVAREELSFAALREALLKDLPDYMVPSAFVQLQVLPLTSNGKIDRQALPEPEALIQISGEYVAPRTEAEEGIAGVWSEVLGVARVGIRDNFIELGGDSIKAIQLASRMNSAGFEVKIKDIFTYQTIEELVPHLSGVTTTSVDQGYAEGTMPLTGIQRWFFAGNPEEPYHYNQSVLFALNPAVDVEVLAKAFAALLQHHDTLRINYRSQGNGAGYGELFYNEAYLTSEPQIEHFDLTNLPAEEQDQQMEFWGGQLKAGFSLENSMLWKVAIFDLGQRGRRLLITVHHLLIDGVSWRILLEDLLKAYQELAKGSTVKLPAKTHSFKDWANGIVQYSAEEELQREIPYWEAVLQKVYPLPADSSVTDELPVGEGGAVVLTIATEAVLSGTLNHDLTQRLLTRANSAYNTGINDLLLTALARTVTGWTGRDYVVITLEGHGREEILPGLDISRTLGWFTSLYPVCLDLSGQERIAGQIQTIKEQLRAIPHKGVGYLIARYITAAPSLQSFAEPDGIIFNYLGQFDGGATAALFEAASEFTGLDSSGARKRRNRLEFSGSISGGQLQLSITYSTQDYTAPTVERLVASYLQNLQAVIEHCTTVDVGCFTPSDFPLAELTQDFLAQIDKRVIEDIYPLSPLQEGMLYHYLYDQNAANYFEQSVFTLEGELNLKHLEEAWNSTIRHNDVLRTIFCWKGVAEPVQLVCTHQKNPLGVYDLQGVEALDLTAALDKVRAEDRARQFDLAHGPNMRISVILLGEKQYQIIMSHHHILFDGWCLGLIFTEIFETYLLLQQGKTVGELEKNYRRKTRYREYISWLKSRDPEQARTFWSEYLREFTEPTALPVDYHTTSPVQGLTTQVLTHSWEFTQRLEKLAKELKVTPNTLLQTTWGLLLQRYNNTTDVVLGAIVSGRPAEIPGIEEMIGLFINAIPVRVQTYPDLTVATLLQQTQAESVTRQEYEYASLTWIKELSELKSGTEQLFESLFVFENYPVDRSVSDVNPGFRVTGYEAFELTNYDLNLEALYMGDTLEVRFGYNPERFKSETIARLMEHYDNLLQDLVTHPVKRIRELELLSSAERELLLTTFNDTVAAYPADRLIHSLIEEQVLQYPEKVAVVYEGQSLTYAEYNRRANRLARILREQGVGPDEIVGILTDPSLEMLIAVLAVLKAGAAFLPVDSRYPDDRIRYMLTDAGSKVLLTQAHLAERANWPCACLVIDEEVRWAETVGLDASNLPYTGSSANLAYVIYTSGSTGVPKGVMIEHRSLVNLALWYAAYHEISAADKATRYAGFSFDASISELFPALISGAEVHVIPERLRLDLGALNAYFEEQGITLVFLPTVMGEQFMKLENRSLRLLDTGGDKLKFYNNTPYNIIDCYGPTENTIITTAFTVDRAYANIPIGKPVANNRVYILDRQGALQPVGVPGEICVAGVNLARGYWNNPALTAEKFVPNPFVSGERMYHTGDLARWLPDGNIEFLGRQDFQVKIRGYRIDLGEIEAQLLAYPSVKKAVVVAREDANGSKYLTAYIVATDTLNVVELRAFLSKRLPEYMIPEVFMQLESFPVTVNGKIDRRALPEVEGRIATGTEYLPPTTPVEEALVEIWRSTLGVERVGVFDNFFALGGHSLKATTVVARIYQELGVEVPISTLFACPTVKELGVAIAALDESEAIDAIKRVPARNYYPVSSAQKRMFVLYHMDAATTQYNVPSAFHLTGDVDVTRLEQVFQALVNRHESLRTSFAVVDGEYVQRIAEEVTFQVERLQGSGSELATVMEQFIRPFDLAKAPLFRVGLVEQENESLLMIDLHHIIADGVSVEILLQEFGALYRGQKLPELKVRYRDYAVWEHDFLRSPAIEKQEAYWLNRMAGDIPVLVLPYDYPRPALQDISGNTLPFALSAETTMRLRELAAAQGVTLYMVLLAIFNALLARYSGQEDIIVGTPVAGRRHADLEGVIGMFVNTLVMRNAPAGEKTFAAFLEEVGANAVQAYENQDYQFEMLVEKLNLERDLSRNPLFDVLFLLQNQISIDSSASEQAELDGLQLSPYGYLHSVAKFDLSVTAYEAPDGLTLTCEYKTSLFKQQTVERIIQHFVQLASAVALEPTQRLAAYRMLSPAEEEQLLVQFNATERSYPAELTLVQMFEAQVERTPDVPALRSAGQIWTYRELNAQANQLARVLREKGLGPNQIAALILERSPEMAAGLLAVLKAGGAYLPIDPAYPVERVGYLLTDSGAMILLTQSKVAEKIPFTGEVVLVDQELCAMDNAEETNLASVAQPDDLAYVIYTSGTTGQPKGVMIEHRSIANTIQWARETYPMSPATKVLGVLSYAFDAFGMAFYTALVSGAQFVMLADEEIKDPLVIKRTIVEEEINHLGAVPSLYANLLEILQPGEGLSLRTVQVGGEKLTTRLIARSKEILPVVELFNEYGPTENSIITSAEPILAADQSVTIGKPVANCQVYIVDRHGQLQPVGVVGELCVGGRGLARGYLNQPELTAERFIANPYTGERMYRTGDLARWLPDGRIDFIGRLDHQVKIRGYRIELGEIEAQLLTDVRISEAVIIDREDGSGTTYLTAYYVAEEEVPAYELKEMLAGRLPQYMVPAYYIRLLQLPLTVNGKIDRQVLPVPDHQSIAEQVDYVAAENEWEERLAQIWAEVLGLQRVGTLHNFFELGGHSLKATQVSAKIYQRFHLEVPLRDIFRYPTIKKLVNHMRTLQTTNFTAIEYTEQRDNYPVSSAQKRLLILDQFEGIGVTYNLPGAMLIRGNLDRTRLLEALNQLLRRHEVLRTSFHLQNGELVQVIQNEVNFQIEEINGLTNEEEVLGIIRQFVRRFNLSQAPLFRVGLAEMSENRYLLLYDLHHTVADGLTMQILMRDLAALYAGQELPELRMQYKDFAVWQANLLASGEMQKQEEYWVSRFADGVPALELPTDYPRPVVMGFAGDTWRFSVNREIRTGLHELASREGLTLYMVLFAAFNVLLARYSGQDDIVIGAPVAGRTHAELADVAGMFVNTLALRQQPVLEKTYLEFLREVGVNTITAFENQDYQFELLLDRLNLERDLSRNPLFDVSFILQNLDTENANFGEGELTFTQYPVGNQTAKFDLLLNVFEGEDGLSLALEYSTHLFKRETIERMGQHFVHLLTDIVANPIKQLGDLQLLSAEERQWLLNECNRTATDVPVEQVTHQLIAAAVEEHGERTAVVYEGQKLTYRQLWERANRLAKILRRKGAGPERIVGIMLEPCLDMLTGLLGVLQAGSAFLPIDPAYPAERIKYFLHDSQSLMLITQAHLAEKLRFSGEILLLEDLFGADSSKRMGAATLAETAAEGSVTVSGVTPENLAYVIYTSGSTGQPKGVMIEHRGLVNLSCWFKNYYALSAEDRSTRYAGFGFDASLMEVFPFLMAGAEIHILSDAIRLNLDKLNQYYEANGITVSFLPSQVAEKFIRLENHSLRCLLTGGDKFKHYHPTSYRLVDNYGPTENTIVATAFELDRPYTNSPVGKPIYNNRVYVLDARGNVHPTGVPGELCLAGMSLARGYLHRPELTAEKFVSDPFVPGARMYRTGDLARWLPDGNLEFLGRMDQQVKIRGLRIELGEIEAQMLVDERTEEVIVLDQRDEDGNITLVAYYVAGAEIPAVEWKKLLQQSLPEYMVPTYFVRIDAVPMTPNGKVNRKALPAPDFGSHAREYTAPTNEVEVKLAKIWSNVLGMKRISIHDDFFELGGHSLKATDVMAQIYREFGVEISLKMIFKTPTIHGLAEMISQTTAGGYAGIHAVEERDYYPVSSAQRRLYILHQLQENSISYNIPSATLIESEIDVADLEHVIQILIDRHEAFRTSFDFVEGEPVQRIWKNVEFKLERYSLQGEELGEESEAAQKAVQKFIRPFDLTKAPLLRVGVVELGGKQLLLMDVHHIIADGTAMSIVLDELAQLYNGKPLAEVTIQYKDFAVWQNEFFRSERIKKQEQYWLQQFSGEIPVLDLPTDFPRPSVMTYEGATVSFNAEPELTKQLNQFVAGRGGSMFMLLLSAFHVLLAKYSGQDEIVVGSPIAGRSHADLARVVGMFVNTLALRTVPKAEKTLETFYEEVKETALQAYDHQDYQFEMLVEKLALQRDLNRNPLFDAMLVLQNFALGKEEISDVQFKPYSFDLPVTKFDILLNARESVEGIYFVLQYWTRIFTKETMERLGCHFLRVLEAFVMNPQQTIGEAELLTPQERQHVLYELNDTRTDYQRNVTVHQLVEAQVDRTPDAIAVRYNDGYLTYRELNAKANRLARELRRQGAKTDEVIGLMVERSLEMVVGILAILKAGSAYLPIDPAYPVERIDYMLEESGACLLLVGTAGAGMGELPGLLHARGGELAAYGSIDSETMLQKSSMLNYRGTVIDITDSNLYLKSADIATRIAPGSEEPNLDNWTAPSNLVYVIYTSGSTGKPKGVMLEHQNVCNLLQFEHAATPVNYRSKVLQFASISFDVSFQEIFSTLTAGGELCLVPQELRDNIPQLLRYVGEQRIEILFLPAAVVKYIFGESELMSDLSQYVRDIIVAGEQLVVTQSLREYMAAHGVRLHNHYGPSETHVVTTLTMQPDAVIPDLPSIGRPVANTQIYILDRNNHPQPVGVPGELCIAGRNVGRGYRNRPDLSAGKFVENPFIPGERMYRTGDIARWKGDGTLEFMGRMDQQVKIRGFRIEPGEIESKLLDHPAIHEAVVVDRTDPKGSKYLVAYLVLDERTESDGEAPLSVADFREYLLQDLPEYMVPAHFVKLAALPLTPNGKVNRRALPEVQAETIVTGDDYMAPTSDVEERLARIWSELLGIERVGIRDNFFTLGGHSLKATSLVAKIYREFGMDLPLREIFRTPTIEALAVYIGNADSTQSLRNVEDENLVLLRRGGAGARNLFLVHDGTGEVGGYLGFCNQLTIDFNCWGIQADRRQDCAVENLWIPEIASKYIEKIRSVDPEGPYYLTGWSLGGSIAFEMARQLEVEKANVAYLALIDSLAPQKSTAQEFTVQSEWQWIMDTFPQLVAQGVLTSESAATVEMKHGAKGRGWLRGKGSKPGKTEPVPFTSLMELWSAVERAFSTTEAGAEMIRDALPANVRAAIPNVLQAGVPELLHYLNWIRSLNRAHAAYTPESELDIPVVYFKATGTDRQVMKNWSRYCQAELTVHEVRGNHFTIMQGDAVTTMIRVLSDVVKK